MSRGAKGKGSYQHAGDERMGKNGYISCWVDALMSSNHRAVGRTPGRSPHQEAEELRGIEGETGGTARPGRLVHFTM